MRALNRTALGYHIAEASGWPSYLEAEGGVDPQRVNQEHDGGEVHLLLISFVLPADKAADALDALKQILSQVAKMPIQKQVVKVFDELSVTGVKGPVLPVLISTELGKTVTLLRLIFEPLCKKIGLPYDEESFPPPEIIFGEATPAEAVWCLWNLRTLARLMRVELVEQGIIHLVKFIRELAERRLEFLHLTEELYRVADEAWECGRPTDWYSWKVHTKREPPPFARAVTPRQVSGLLRRSEEDQLEYLTRLFTRIYAYRLAEYRQTMRSLLDKIRQLEELKPQLDEAELKQRDLTPELINQAIEAIVLSRVISEVDWVGGDADPGQTVWAFGFPDDPEPAPLVDLDDSDDTTEEATT